MEEKSLHTCTISTDAPALSPEQGAVGSLYIDNGVYAAPLEHAGKMHRLGSTNARFLEELSSLAPVPSPEDLEALQQKGLWLGPAYAGGKSPKVAITCGGVGSVWPGMGRALYDTFPAARAAMDRLAAVASWDVLALMDEKDMEKLQHTRWQMPYLFFVEFAQAAHLQSLGFAPCLMSGHSLGELISLCLAGVYEPEIAWQIFDRRAVYMEGLERDAKDGMGMMAVYGSYEKVQALLEVFPDLHICNHNTPTQFMLGGKKEQLSEAKRALRKEKCPALVLPINTVFHHPHLRVLRQSAVDGLMGLPTFEPSIPVLSNVTTGLYPVDKKGIVEYIADLDENTVRWVDCVRAMWERFEIRHFVEIGSADNICTLVKDIEPRATCIPVSLKNAEVETMRAAVAHLYALGHIPVSKWHSVPLMDHAKGEKSQEVQACEVSQDIVIPEYVQDVLPIFAEASGFDVAALRPQMDIRHELAIRSNRFPFIMHKIEQSFGITLRLEDVLQVVTVQDFALVVARLRGQHLEPVACVAPVAENAPKKPVITAQVPVLSHENMRDYPYLFPLSSAEGSYTFGRNFSAYENSPWQDEAAQNLRAPSLMGGQGAELWHPLYHAAQLAMELQSNGTENTFYCCGVDALELFPQNISSVTQGPQGVTREGRIQVSLERGENAPAYTAELALRALSANGRRQDQWDTAAKAKLYFTGEDLSPAALWQKDEGIKQIQMRKKFANGLGLGYTWVAEILLLLQQAVGEGLVNDTNNVLKSVQKIRHAAKPNIFEDNLDIQELTLQWHPCAVATSAFSCWDGQVLNEHGTVLLTVQGLCF